MKNELLETYTSKLLHLNEPTMNRLIDLRGSGQINVFFLKGNGIEQSSFFIRYIKDHYGKMPTMLIKGSMVTTRELGVAPSASMVSFQDRNGNSDPKALDQLIEKAYQDLNLKGNNPLFLSVGAIRYDAVVGEDNSGMPLIKEIATPILIFPIRLVRGSSVSPVSIEFVADNAYLNPCLLPFLKLSKGVALSESFPLPPTKTNDDDITLDLDQLGDGASYFNSVAQFVGTLASESDGGSKFILDKEIIAIGGYNHGDMCMFHDIRRNKGKVLSSELVDRAFTPNKEHKDNEISHAPTMTLSYDSSQQKIVANVCSGNSMVIQGPPGSGKTLTIANMIGSLLAEGKKVLVSSTKIAAMSEVYAKLPAKIRDFALLLDAESEKDATKISVSGIKLELNRILSEKNNHRKDQTLESEIMVNNKSRSEAIKNLSAYCKFLFNEEQSLFGKTLFAVEDRLLALKNVERVDFFEDKKILDAFNDKAFALLMDVVKTAWPYYQKLTENETIPLVLNPWWGFDGRTDYEEVIKTFEFMKGPISKVLEISKKISEGENAWLLGLPVGVVLDLAKGNMDVLKADLLENPKPALFTDVLSQQVGRIENLSQEKQNQYSEAYANSKKDFDDFLAFIKQNEKVNDLELPLDRAKTLASFCSDYAANGSLNQTKIDFINEYCEEMDNISKMNDEMLDGIHSVFKAEVTDETLRAIKGIDSLIAYKGTDKDRPGIFDGKAKNAYNECRALSFLSNPSFQEIVEAAANILTSKTIEETKAKKANEFERVFRHSFNQADIDKFVIFTHQLKKLGVRPEAYSDWILRGVPLFSKVATLLGERGDITIKDLVVLSKDAAFAENLHAFVVKTTKEVGYGVSNLEGKKDTDVYHAYKALSVIAEHADYAKRSAMLESIGRYLPMIQDTYSELIGVLTRFGEAFFKNYYTINALKLKPKELEIFIENAEKKDMSFAALSYAKIVTDEKFKIIEPFFTKFNTGKATTKNNPMPLIFEASLLDMAANYHLSKLGNEKSGIASEHRKDIQKYIETEAKALTLNEHFIRERCLNQIVTTDNRFSFLSKKNDSSSLRLLFKENALGIMNLKPCIIASPSTVSTLFRNNLFDQFDTVIVDEASQIVPVSLIPLLFRGKNIVVLGDEWQMPPMEHFAKSLGTDDQSLDERLSVEPSALALVQNGAFLTENLNCHFRSRTESLIKFSQEAFYPFLVTFPSPVPKKPGLGFRDVFVENATMSGGTNEPEARRVIELLKEHFATYFDGKVLKESVGVVTFGESQMKYIERLIASDKELKNAIETAQSNRSEEDTPERVFFIKTIEKVQGQETDHLILSVTYGVNKDGDYSSSFAQLSRGSDNLGKRIFNVAVTRAKSSITVVHSIRAENIKEGTKAEFIKDYLYIAEKFSNNGFSGAFNDEPKTNLQKEIASFLVEEGIPADRIAFDYGVTAGSVKIPLVILDEEKKTCLGGLISEKPNEAKNTYIDSAVRYPRILANNYSWKLEEVTQIEWSMFQGAAKAKIKKYLSELTRY